MSDTPKTDELAKREFVPDGVWIRHARELERENAALREKAERYRLVTLRQDADNTALCNKLAALENQTQWECSCGGTDCEGQKENAALKDCLDWAETILCNSLPMQHSTLDEWNEIINKWRDSKHAIDAARAKEAQPCQCTNGVIRSVGRDNDEVIEDCPDCSGSKESQP